MTKHTTDQDLVEPTPILKNPAKNTHLSPSWVLEIVRGCGLTPIK